MTHRESPSSLPTTHSEEQGRREKTKLRESPSDVSLYALPISPLLRFPTSLSIFTSSSSSLSSLLLTCLQHIHPSSTIPACIVAHVVGVCTSACLITTGLQPSLFQEHIDGRLPLQQTFSNSFFFLPSFSLTSLPPFSLFL